MSVLYEKVNCCQVCDSRLVSVKDFWTNPRNIFAMHETAGLVDGSMATKLTGTYYNSTNL